MTDFTPNVVKITSSKCVWPEIWPVSGACSWEARSEARNHSHLQSIIVCQVSFPTNASIGRWKNIQTADRKYPGQPSSCWLVVVLSRNILFPFLFFFSFHRICTNIIGEDRKKIHGHFCEGFITCNVKSKPGWNHPPRNKHPGGPPRCSAMSQHKLGVIGNNGGIRSSDSGTVPPLWARSNWMGCVKV